MSEVAVFVITLIGIGLFAKWIEIRGEKRKGGK